MKVILFLLAGLWLLNQSSAENDELAAKDDQTKDKVVFDNLTVENQAPSAKNDELAAKADKTKDKIVFDNLKVENQAYTEFINTDSLHASCYVVLCKCGLDQYSGTVSDVHEKSCDTHRFNEAEKITHMCTKNPDTCYLDLAKDDRDIFADLPRKIREYRLNNEACNYYMATCYGYLINIAVQQFYQDLTSGPKIGVQI